MGVVAGPDFVNSYFAPVVASALNLEGNPTRSFAFLGFALKATDDSARQSPAAERWSLLPLRPPQVFRMSARRPDDRPEPVRHATDLTARNGTFPSPR